MGWFRHDPKDLWEQEMKEAESAIQGGRLGKAEDHLQQALRHAERIPPDKDRTDETRERLATLHAEREHWGEAEDLHRARLADIEARIEHTQFVWIRRTSALADVLSRQDRGEEAEQIVLKVRSRLEVLYGVDHRLLARVNLTLANLWCKKGEFQQAEPLYEGAILIMEKSDGPNSLHLEPYLQGYAVMLRMAGRDGEAHKIDDRIAKLR